MTEFPTDGKVSSWKNNYLLPCRELPPDEFDQCMKRATIALIGFARYTKILGTQYEFRDIKKLRKNETALFVGALLFKFSWVMKSRTTLTLVSDPSEPPPIIKDGKLPPLCESLKSLNFLFPLTCVPNCRSILASNNKHIMYALQPIKEGTPLLSSSKSIYQGLKKSERVNNLQELYHRNIKCQACEEDWFEYKTTGADLQREINLKPIIGLGIMQEMDLRMEELNNQSKEILCDSKLLAKTCNIVEKAWQHFSMPSLILKRVTSNLMLLFDRIFYPFPEEVPPYECKKGFSSDGKFEGYKSIYAQPLFKVPASEIETYSCTAALALVGLAKYTNILGENYNGGDMRLLVKNKVAVFVGALMLKFCLVIHCRRTSILIVDPSELIGGKKATIPENPDVSTSIKSLGFMNITACAPNIHNFLTYGNKYFVYAVQPIKKGASLVGSISSIYHNTPRSERQATYMKYYGAPCKCQACTENWLEIIQDESKYKECARSKPLEFSEILEEMEWIEEEIKDKKHKLNNIDVKLLSKARNLVAKSWKQFPLPTYITARTISVLMAVYNTFFFPLDLEPERTNSCTK
ncbi:hypothetical protein QAD02_001295 [Eretmocerus hayati]|uniref:Uncharacterized protein n=1 Tax=Eretmocerus hayati TaxID=131215 RepID=A0ACC2NGJ9_9HYME|nr:hypothetical protein QAD02_001295 [Eretmocerus hayati]